MNALEDFHIQALNVKIMTKDYLETSCNFLIIKKIKEKNLLRIIEICKSSILKQILSLLFWLYICNVQAFKNITND